MCQALGLAVTATWVCRQRACASGALRRDRRMGLSILPPGPLGRRNTWAGRRKRRDLAIPRSGEALLLPGEARHDLDSQGRWNGGSEGFARHGISEAVLEQVQASLVPKRTDAGNAWEKASADTKAQLHSLRVRIGRQEKAVENAQESLNSASEKLLHMRHEADQVLPPFLRWR